MGLLDQGVHYGKEERREPREHKHACIPGGVGGRLLEGAQDLVWPASIDVVVRVPLYLEEHPICDAVAGVPRVHPAGALIVVVEAPLVRAVAAALAAEAVMLDVVGVVREEGGEEGLHELQRQGLGAQAPVDGEINGEGGHEGHEDPVLQAEEAPAPATLKFGLQAQGRDEALEPAPEDEGPEGLVEGGAGRVFVGGYALVVAPQVLDPKVVVIGKE
mmetsp:Transcript_85249/g.236189  ORF Transcript_85249/g.236189 Transcript_85249/m.236189 type:complete len:217 (+) Transcript_85249:186-836(+)